MGVHLPSSAQINRHLKASIIRPDGGPTLMVFNNFKVLMAWNYSSYYAGTVTYMADKICQSTLTKWNIAEYIIGLKIRVNKFLLALNIAELRAMVIKNYEEIEWQYISTFIGDSK